MSQSSVHNIYKYILFWRFPVTYSWSNRDRHNTQLNLIRDVRCIQAVTEAADQF
jgi:hypothetical protein